MIAIEKTNNTGKLLVAVAVFAMVICAFAVATPAEADGAVTVPSDATAIDKVADISETMEAGDYKITTALSISTETVIPEGVTIYVLAEGDNTGSLTITAPISVDGSVVFLYGSSLTMNDHNYFGTRGYIQPTEGASLTVSSNANDGYDMVFDGTANVPDSLPIWTSETFTITTGSTLNVSGILTFNGLFTNNGTLNITGTATIHDGRANLVNNGVIDVAKSATLTIDKATGTLRNNGTIYNNGTVANSGILNNYGAFYNNDTVNNNKTLFNAGQIYSSKPISNVTGSSITNGFGISNNMDAIETNLDLTGYAFLTSDLTIPENKSITVGPNAILDLRGYTLTVDGELIVSVGGQVIGYDGDAENTDNAIVLSKGTITNNGTIGSGQVPVTIGVDQDDNDVLESYVETLNVEGVSYGTTTVGADKKVYLTVTGDVISAITTSDNFVFNMENVYIVGEMTISEEIVSTLGTSGVTVASEAILTIDGEVTGTGDIVMQDNSTVVIAGTCDVHITAGTGKAQTTNYIAPGTTTVTLDNVTGVTISVSSTSSVETESGKSVRYTVRVMNISGAVDLIDDTIKGSINVVNTTDETSTADKNEAGISYVPAETTLSIPEDVAAALGGTVVNGTVVYSDNNSVKEYVGTQYSIREGTETTYYIQSFTEALGQIANAYRNTVNVSGPVEVKEDFTLTDGQTVNIADTTYGDFTISADATVTVQSGARISGTVEEVVGVLVLQRGAPDAVVNKYAVSSQSSDGTRTYSGFAAAIANSAAGDTITVIGQGYDSVAVKGNVSIPADRTVIVQKDMEFSGNLVIEAGATLDNQATIAMTGDKSTITVNGTMKNASTDKNEDPVVFTKTVGNYTDRGISSTGEFIVNSLDHLALGGKNTSSNPVNAAVNGALYINKDGKYVLTSFSNAVAAMADANDKAIAILGTVTESGNITIGNGEDLISVEVGIIEGGVINVPGIASLGDVTINYSGFIVNNNGSKLTANISGEYGVEGSTSVATVALDGASNLTVGNTSDVNELAETVWYMSIDGTPTGSVIISAGEVKLVTETAVTIADNNTLTISAGATLVVPENVTLNLNKNVVISGTLHVEESGTVSVAANTIATVAGTLEIDGTLEIAAVSGTKSETNKGGELVLTGTLNITEDGTATIAGTMRLGETPKTLGAVSSDATVTGNVTVTGKIIAYSGSDLTGATINAAANTSAKYTAYTINGISYATVYGVGTISDIDAEVKTLKDLKVGEDGITWYSGEIAATGSIGTYEAVSSEISYNTVMIQVSVGSQISIVIDGVVYGSSTPKDLTIGTHTVSAIVNPGFTGDITISFNGQPVTNGQIEITSDMIGESIVLSATGELSYDVGSGTVSEESGMSLTDILLIVLVVLILVMAIIVALRLMRS